MATGDKEAKALRKLQKTFEKVYGQEQQALRGETDSHGLQGSPRNDGGVREDGQNTGNSQALGNLEGDGQKNTATEGGGVRRSLSKMTQHEIDGIQAIEEKSVNQFTSTEIKATEYLARKYWSQEKMRTKSPFFRAWFGDWRAYDTTPVQIANQAGNTRGLQNNEDTGWDISVSGKVFNETVVHTDSPNKAARKYLPYINDVVRKAILLDSYVIPKEKTKSVNSLLMHSFYAVADIGNGPEIIKLYVEEMNDPNAENTMKRAYQLQNVEKYRLLHRVHSNTASSISTGSGVDSVADLFAAVKDRDAKFSPNEVNPALLNEDGTPKVFYHGTDQRFTVFDPAEMGAREGSYFFAENKEDAQAYGKNVYEVYLQGRKLADYDNQPSEFYKLKDKRQQVQWLKDKGYDGWYADMDSGGWGEVSVFNNTQVKSAADNIGTFDGKNPDINYSFSKEGKERNTGWGMTGEDVRLHSEEEVRGTESRPSDNAQERHGQTNSQGPQGSPRNDGVV